MSLQPQDLQDFGVIAVADTVIDLLLERAVLEARRNELEKYKESFGSNHSIENSAMVILNFFQTKDESKEQYDFSADQIEPAAPGLDNNAETSIKNIKDFDADNFIDVVYSLMDPGEKEKYRQEHARKFQEKTTPMLSPRRRQ